MGSGFLRMNEGGGREEGMSWCFGERVCIGSHWLCWCALLVEKEVWDDYDGGILC